MAKQRKICRACGTAYGYTMVGKKIEYTEAPCDWCGRVTETAPSSEFGYPELIASRTKGVLQWN